MTHFIAISNRRGGVGKTTVTMMLAYGLAVTGQQRVLVIDLDPQSSTSTVLMGGERLKEARRSVDDHGLTGCTIAGLLLEMFGDGNVDVSGYISTDIGDVIGPQGKPPHLHIIPGSYELDDREIEMIIAKSRTSPTLGGLFDRVQRRVGEIVRSVDGSYDYVLIDCAPGLSQVVWGALRIADFVIIPYVPDKTAEDNVSWFADKLQKVSRAKVRTLANRVTSGNQGAASIIHDRFGGLGVTIPSSLPLSNALDFTGQRRTMGQKFGAANPLVNQLLEAVLEWVRTSGR